MLREGADNRSRGPRRWPLVGALAVAASLVAPQLAGATGNVTVTVNPPQFDPKDGNYGVFSGSVTNAPMPDSTSGCFQLGDVGCIAQFALYPAGVPGSLQLGPLLIWGLQGPSTTSVAVTINMSTAPGVVPGTTYQAVLQAFDSSGTLWESARTPPFQWPPDKLTLSKVRLLDSPSGDSAIRYRLGHGGTPFSKKARVAGSIFDGSEKLGTFAHKVKPGTLTRLLPDSIGGMLVEGQSYRVRVDAKDSLGREARFRGKLER